MASFHVKNSRTSSIELAAVINVGIPFRTPSFFDCNCNICGTTTAGETAARVNPVSSAQDGGSELKKKEVKTATAAASTRQGVKASKPTIALRRFRTFKSRLKPARKRITIKAKLRIVEVCLLFHVHFS
ncbi:hypothetical protein TYRP_010959 [Tyrophagus putrescentiae]|nr:hypothetical protein TYRP_010959 [Tyrophagus putrescentiae]